MKKTVKRRRFLRINSPAAFGVFCGLLVLAIGGAAFGLGAGVIAPAVKAIQADKAQQSAVVSAEAVETALPAATADIEDTADVGDAGEVGETEAAETGETEATGTETAETTPELIEIEETPEPEATATPALISGEDQGFVGGTGRLSGHIIAIDAAKSKGCKYKGISSKTSEHEINFKMAQAVKEALEAEGATVVMSRAELNEQPGDSGRVKTINASGAELTVSLMCNYIDAHDTRGTQVIVSTKNKNSSDSKKLAKAVINGYKEYTDMPIRGNGDGIRTSSSWSTINGVKMPACLLILGHISNKTDDQNLNDDSFIARGAQGIVSGIISYLG